MPRLHVVTTFEILRRPGFTSDARRLLGIEGVALHLRARGDTGRLLLARAVSLHGAATSGAALLVNDRVDVACASGAGAHLPEAGLTPFQARTILGHGALLGRSVHGPAAAAEGLPHLDYLLFGHVFATPTKPLPPAGPEGLASVVAAAGGLPVLAIGGVAPANVRPLIEAGAHGVAAISGIWGTSDAAETASRYLAAIEASGAAPSRSLAGRPDVRGA